MKWGVVFIRNPKAANRPDVNLMGWVNNKGVARFFDTRDGADRLARKKRMQAHHRGWDVRYMVAEAPDD